ncbi:MAG: hypothetical protein DELT_02159 [Desulfovibrio sp.]
MKETQSVKWYSYVILFLAVAMFSGMLTKVPAGWEPLKALDFTTLNGVFGNIKGAEGNFVGVGGSGARGGFLFALGLIPAVILALGVVRIVDGYGGLAAAEKLITPLFRPLLGIPGIAGLAFITSLQSTDGAAGMTKELYDSGHITDKERSLFCMLQLSADGTITNYFSSIAALFMYFGPVPIFLPLIVIFICKFLGVNMLRLIMSFEKNKAQA